METLPPSPGVAFLRGVRPEIHLLPRGSELARIWFAGSSSENALFRRVHRNARAVS